MQTPSLRGGAWLALVAALLGWMFDGFEMGLFPLIARPALKDLLPGASDGDITHWISIIQAAFLVGAATGGVLFGWLGDRIGRVKAMTLSVLVYAIFSGVCGLSTAAWQVALFRFIASLGMGGEWALGVALVMELWPDKSRAWLAGMIGAAGNLGYVLIAVTSLALNQVTGEIKTLLEWVRLSPETIEWLTRSNGWRVLMLCGTLPALLTFLIRLLVPESHKWEEERDKGHTKSDSRDLIGVLVGMAAGIGIITIWAIQLPLLMRLPATVILLALVVSGYIHPIRRNLARSALSPEVRKETLKRVLLAACLSGVALLGTWGSVQLAPTWADELSEGKIKEAKAYTQICSALGATLFCALVAVAGIGLPRRWTYTTLCAASLLMTLGFYRLNTGYGTPLLVSAFFLGGITASFYGWLPLYLPELFPTALRASGQGFGYNFGRVIAAVGVLQLPVIRSQFEGGYAAACPVLAMVYLVGMVLIWFAPETRGKPLPE